MVRDFPALDGEIEASKIGTVSARLNDQSLSHAFGLFHAVVTVAADNNVDFVYRCREVLISAESKMREDDDQFGTLLTEFRQLSLNGDYRVFERQIPSHSLERSSRESLDMPVR